MPARARRISALAREPRVLETEDLSVLTGWAQAIAEAVAYAPECLDTLLADAGADAPWRAALQLAEPSRSLCDVVSFIDLAVRAATPRDGVPPFDELVASCRDDRPDAPGLEALARRVLRSALDQIGNRRAMEKPHREWLRW